MHCAPMSTRDGGPTLSRVVAGMWRMAEWKLDVQQRIRLLEQCIELGVTTFDHADIYGGHTVQTLFGQALAQHPALKQQLQIVTKCGIVLPHVADGVRQGKRYDLSAQHIEASVDDALRLLGVETLQVLLMHRPSPLMDFDTMAATFHRLHRAGKVQHFGVSNFTPTQFRALNSRYPLATNQVEFSPLHLQALDDGQFDTLQELRVAPMVWSALGGGGLFSTDSEQATRIVRLANAVGERLGLSTAGVIYAWIMRLPCKPLPLSGSGRIERIRDAVAASQVQMQDQDWFDLLQAMRGNEVP